MWKPLQIAAAAAPTAAAAKTRGERFYNCATFPNGMWLAIQAVSITYEIAFHRYVYLEQSSA